MIVVSCIFCGTNNKYTSVVLMYIKRYGVSDTSLVVGIFIQAFLRRVTKGSIVRPKFCYEQYVIDSVIHPEELFSGT